MFENVFIFGAGADNNFYSEVPLGNELVIRIFSNLKKVREIIKNEKDEVGKDSLYSLIYNSFKKQLFGEKKSNNYFFEWKGVVASILKNGIEKLSEDIFPRSNDNFSIEIVVGKQLMIDKNHLEAILRSNDEDVGQFFVSLLINVYGSSITKDLRKNMVGKVENKIRNEFREIDGNYLNRLFENLETPVYFRPESVIKKYTKKFLKRKIAGAQDFSDIEKEIYEKYILKIFDYTVVFDELYDIILNYDLENTSPAKVLRYLHFVLTMDYTLKELEKSYWEFEEVNKNENAYYNILKQYLKSENDYIVNLNYTNFLERTLENKAKVNHIHGRVGEYMVLEDRRIIGEEEVSSIKDKKIIPNFVPQSLLKLIISVRMIERYYKSYEALKDAEKCIIVGFGLNRDDAHILNILQTALRFNDKLKVFIYAGKDIKNNSGYQILSRDNGNRIEIFDYEKCSFEDFFKQIEVIR